MTPRLSLLASDITVTSDRNRVLLDVPALSLDPGQSLGISGPSGAGKSTLLYALAGLLANVGGRVSWGATELLGLSAARRGLFRSQNMGLIFQDFLLFEELSALDNATLPGLYLPRAKRQQLENSAKAHLERLGITQLDRPVASFSGGERQRVAVARALANDAPVLLADEPTASLNRAAANQLTEDLIDICRRGGKTLIVVSHDLFLLDRLDRILTLADGRVREDTGVTS